MSSTMNTNDSNNEVSVKANVTAVASVPRMMIVAVALCLAAPLVIILSSRSVNTAEDHIRAGREKLKFNGSSQTFAHSQLFDPLLRNSNETIDANANVKIQYPTTARVNYSDDRLVLELNNTYAYWRDTQSGFCDLIRQITNVSILGIDRPYHVRNNQPPPLLRSTFNCVSITTNNQLGTGNWISAFYAMRMVAALGMVDFEIQCRDGMKQDTHHLISWFTGYFAAPSEFQKWPYGPDTPQEGSACQNKYAKLRIHPMVHAMQSDVRKLAVTVFGTKRELGWSHPLVPENQLSLFTNVELDQVVIHFRCGDILGGVKRYDFGIIHFSEYLKWISNETSTLGIVTQPFTKGKYTRLADERKASECRVVVTALVDYLQASLPNVTIRIRNDPDEPLTVAYARMVISRQVFVSYSSFGIFPVIGTFGEGYFQRGNRGVNPWAIHVPEILPNIHMMNAPQMSSFAIRRAGLEGTLKWLVSPINESARV